MSWLSLFRPWSQRTPQAAVRRLPRVRSAFRPALEQLDERVLLSNGLPMPDHTVVVVFENHAYSQIIGAADAPYINSLVNDARGSLLTQSYGLGHPSQPNYMQFFSGSNQGVTNDIVPGTTFTTPNLASALFAKGFTFAGYSEDLPYAGFTGSSSGAYYRKHAPWVSWQGSGTNGIPASANQPLSAFPTDYSQLPTVSFVIPNINNSMHDASVGTGDTWLKNKLDGYVQWAKAHNSLLVVTFDEDNDLSGNHIATVMVGQTVKHGQYGASFNHYNVLRTVEDMYGLAYAGASASAAPITAGWVAPTTVSIVATDGSAGEGGSNPGTFVFSRTGNTGSALIVTYTIGGSATNGLDYQKLSGSVTIAAGAASTRLQLLPIDDILVEGNESVTLTVTASSSYTVGASKSGTVTIADNDTAPESPTFGTAQVLGNLNSSAMIETSGLVYSRMSPNVLWAHNDSGDTSRVFAVTPSGQLLGTYNLWFSYSNDGNPNNDVAVPAIDYEDIAIGPGPVLGANYIYVADIGDNSSSRSTVQIYRFREPTVSNSANPPAPGSAPVYNIGGVEKFDIRYVHVNADGSKTYTIRNSETMMVDPVTGDVFLVAKGGESADAANQRRVYQIVAAQLRTGVTIDAVHVATITASTSSTIAPNPTGGDISADGSMIAIKNYGEVFIWTRKPGQSIADVLQQQPLAPVVCGMGCGGETIAFAPDGSGFYTVTEGSGSAMKFWKRLS